MFLILPHPLTNFEIQIYHQKGPRINCVYSKSNLPKIKDGAYLTNLDDYKSIGTHWIVLYVNGGNVGAYNNVTYFDSFWVEHILKEIKKFIGNKNITKIIFRMHSKIYMIQ